jgi:hypothetical protein
MVNAPFYIFGRTKNWPDEGERSFHLEFSSGPKFSLTSECSSYLHRRNNQAGEGEKAPFISSSSAGQATNLAKMKKGTGEVEKRELL